MLTYLSDDSSTVTINHADDRLTCVLVDGDPIPLIHLDLESIIIDLVKQLENEKHEKL